MVYMIESEEIINGKINQTKIIRHQGYRRIVKFRHFDKQQISDETKLFKNHRDDCDCGLKFKP